MKKIGIAGVVLLLVFGAVGCETPRAVVKSCEYSAKTTATAVGHDAVGLYAVIMKADNWLKKHAW
ncbi:MAG: hypothetical protein KKC84_05535 [Candidatus Omnitrophica bacterium]|nr:hypothetical protein [Candidatus Omnitrophota bacterium]